MKEAGVHASLRLHTAGGREGTVWKTRALVHLHSACLRTGLMRTSENASLPDHSLQADKHRLKNKNSGKYVRQSLPGGTEREHPKPSGKQPWEKPFMSPYSKQHKETQRNLVSSALWVTVATKNFNPSPYNQIHKTLSRREVVLILKHKIYYLSINRPAHIYSFNNNYAINGKQEKIV